MPLILAIEPDKRQAAQLKVLVRNRLRADLVLADTTERALEAIGDRMPDRVLVPALLSPEEDGALTAALRVIAAAADVQTLTIPVFASGAPKKAPAKSGGLFSKLLPAKSEGAPEGCDPAVFGDQIAAYLSEIAASRGEYDDFDDRPPAAPSPGFARVETFAQPGTFEAAVEDFQSGGEAASSEPERIETPAAPAFAREPEQIEPPAAEPPIFLDSGDPKAAPIARPSRGLQSLFTPRRWAEPPRPETLEWPAPAQPVDEPEAEQEPAAAADNNDWAPPADQSIALDLPPGEEPATLAATSELVEPADAQDPAEEQIWADQDVAAELAEPIPPQPTWTPPSTSRKPWQPAGGPGTERQPADLIAEFTADLVAARATTPTPPPPLKPARTASPPPAPKTKAPSSKPAPQPPPPKPPPIAAEPPCAAAQPKPPAPPATASAFKPKSDRPEWTALIDSLRQDMDRMREDRGRSKGARGVPPPPSVEPAPI